MSVVTEEEIKRWTARRSVYYKPTKARRSG